MVLPLAPKHALHFDRNGSATWAEIRTRPIGIEIVDPEGVTTAEILSVFDKLGLVRPEERELAPLEAAFVPGAASPT
jgi:hypothetical protein